jgi:hypothetical protein
MLRSRGSTFSQDFKRHAWSQESIQRLSSFARLPQSDHPNLNCKLNGWERGMHARDSLTPVFEKVALLTTEMRHLRSVGPHFRIVHRFRVPGSICLPGEEIVTVFLIYRGREYPLRLSASLRIVFDYLARHSRLAQSARQIELGIRADDFYKYHAKNAGGRAALIRRIPRSAIKVHIRRLRDALSLVFQEAGMGIDPGRVLITQETVGNEVGYQLKASCSWTHIDLNSRDAQPLPGVKGWFSGM